MTNPQSYKHFIDLKTVGEYPCTPPRCRSILAYARELEARVKELELRDGDATHMIMDADFKKHDMSLQIADLKRQLAEATQWRTDIENAPRDKCLIASFGMSRVRKIWWNNGMGGFIYLPDKPTDHHEIADMTDFRGWLPLPEKKEDV